MSLLISLGFCSQILLGYKKINVYSFSLTRKSDLKEISCIFLVFQGLIFLCFLFFFFLVRFIRSVAVVVVACAMCQCIVSVCICVCAGVQNHWAASAAAAAAVAAAYGANYYNIIIIITEAENQKCI